MLCFMRRSKLRWKNVQQQQQQPLQLVPHSQSGDGCLRQTATAALEAAQVLLLLPQLLLPSLLLPPPLLMVGLSVA